ncbi:glutamine amidotransferase [Luteimonas sp. MJ204]|uniref:glutamine amidotransferase n=1 Tax=Luteimonas sp. MJ145 TaxID=3129234 RepID=UPI0031BBAD4D
MPRNTPPFLVLETGRPVASMRRHGSFAHWIRTAAGLSRGEVEVVDVQSGDAPPSHRDHAGVLVSGSGAMVSDREPWSERTADWLRDAAHEGAQLFGICYGHQLLAHALGGTVADNPRGREMGTVAIDPGPEAKGDPLFAGLPERFLAQATHLQSVLGLPSGAVALASSDLDGYHAFRWGDAAWGVQFHPEFSAGHMRGYIDARRDSLAAEGLDPAAMRAAVRAAPDARRVLRRFVRRARRHA